MTDHKFETDTFVCIDIAGSPSVQEVAAGTHIATTHPWTQHDTLDDAIAEAQAIDPAFAFDGTTLSGLIAARGE
jgi:hypothetical protein